MFKKYFEKRNERKLKEQEERRKPYKQVEEFAGIGEYIEYLGVKMLVVDHHTVQFAGGRVWRSACLKVEWMNTRNELQQASISLRELKFCKYIGKK